KRHRTEKDMSFPDGGPAQGQGSVRKLSALAHTALKIGSKYSFTPRKLRLFADFCLVWPSLADFSYKA
ncbi:MAG: hypothetical protein ACRC3F_06620, partial [Billgrantia desiderata]